MAKHTHMRAAEIVMMMDTNSALFPLYYDNAPAVDQTISQTKRDANYTSVLHCNWVCVRVRDLKRQNNCTKPKCCVQQCILTVIFVQQENTESKKGTNYNCVCAWGERHRELNISISMDW